jgi:hypothetical protein
MALKENGATQPFPRCRNLGFEVIGKGMVVINHNSSDASFRLMALASTAQPFQRVRTAEVRLKTCKSRTFFQLH